MADNPHDRTRPTPSGRRGESRGAGSFPIVGIGASAGGLEAFSQLLAHLPLDTGMGFVLVQHLDPQHESALTQLLARATSMPVREAANQLGVEPNHVYVIAPNTDLRIVDGVLILSPREQSRTPHRSIDRFFEALAKDQGERAIGVILSGTATDGTLGLEAIKAEGGITFAQDRSARYDSMPRSAAAAGCVDFVLSPEQIAHELARIARHPGVAGAPVEQGQARASRVSPIGDEPAAEGQADDGFRKVLLLLRSHSGVDFSLYKSSTIHRRIARRVLLSKHDTLAQYTQYLRGNTRELDALYADALISVTSFFRNPDAFGVLEQRVWPTLLQQPGADPLRVWVPGCSTGQEAYSMAMAFVEASEKAPRLRKLQIFATDLNDTLLDKARYGLYPRSLGQDLSPDRLRRYFVEEEGGYRIGKPLREMVVFARHNLIGDPAFSRLDLISCRNLLIYLEPSLQQKAFPLFHYALRPGGFLFLGASESIGGFTDLFEPVDKKHKVYTKKAAPTAALQLPVNMTHSQRPPTSKSSRSATSPPPEEAPGEGARGLQAEVTAQREADRVAINQFAPPSVLINADLQILQFRGPTSAYLEAPTGKATFDVLKMARAGLMLPLRGAINKARKDNQIARKDLVKVEQDGATRTVNIHVIPLKNLRERCFLIVFEDAEKVANTLREPGSTRRGRPGAKALPARASRSPGGAEARRIAALEMELAETRDYVRSIQDQHETAREELQASNEEIQSANEELQSINEELETSKEELESTNEELVTVNDEMAARNAELNRVNSDLVNVQTSAHVAIMLVSRDLTIRRFSVQAEKQFHVSAADIGRRMTEVGHNLDLRDLDAFVAEAIDTVCAREREVQDKAGRWFSLRVRPYLTLDNKVDGAVLVLVDIDDLKRSQHAIAAARDYAETIIETVREPLLALDLNGRVEHANRSFYQTFGGTPADTVGTSIYHLSDRQWDTHQLRTLLGDVLERDQVVEGYSVQHQLEGLGARTMLVNARRMWNPDGATGRILLAIEDITQRTQAEDARRALEERYRSLFNSIDEGFCVIEMIFDEHDHPVDYRLLEVSPSFEKQTGLKDVQGRRMREIVPRLEDYWFEIFGKVALTGEPTRFENRAEPLNRSYDVYAFRFGEPNNRQVAVLFSDISERKRSDRALSEADLRKNEFLAMLAHELRNPLAPMRNSLEIMRRARVPSASADPRHPADSAVEMLERQVGQMVRLVDDLLDANRISRGKLQLRKERVELSSVVYHAVEAARHVYEGRGQELTVTLPAESVYLDADPTRLAQIVGNLLNNASKFSERGGPIWLTVEDGGTRPVAGDPSNEAHEVAIRVRDFGIGIGADQLSRVFDLFMQVDTSLERSVTGLGIGLTLVQTLVQLHGGSVEVRSAGLGEGTEFVVRLPTAVGTASATIPSTTPAAVAPRALRILVVDDNRDSAESLALLLQLNGHQTDIAYDGLEAVTAAARLRPEVILLDIGLPGLNGYEAARQIREQQQGAVPTIVALTGWGQDEDRRRSEDAGFDAHMVKPVNVDILMTLLASLGAGDAHAL